MSGICGLFNLDGAPVTEVGLRSMTALLERRGPERTGLRPDGCAGLGHTLLATTPELLFERQPVVHAESGCAITADVRLDNREELYSGLELRKPLEAVGDAELILNAYLTWGEQCVDRLLGDFAFALWEPREQKLYCARDHFGMRPFYYHYAAAKCFVFASDARAILALPQVPCRIDEGRIADFLVPQLEWIDYTSTFFEGIYRLPPGHRLTLTRRGIEITEYWRPAPGPDIGPMTDDEYREGFLDVLTQAVGSRLRSPKGIAGSMLSGGMDSGSVVVVAKDLLDQRGDGPLPTYSAFNADGAACAETDAIRAATSMPAIAPTLIRPELLASDFEALVSGNEEPFDGEMTMLGALYQAAAGQGRKFLLDGAGGDIVLNEGSYISRLLRRGSFRIALHEIAGVRAFWGEALQGALLPRYLRAAFVPEMIKRPLRPAQARRRVRGFLEASLIDEDFARRVGVESRFARMRRTFPSRLAVDYAVERCDAIWPNVTAGRERYARIAAAAGMEARDPFLDKRVVEYCSRLPGRLLMRDGWPKIILRDIMAGRLPEAVRWCRGKPHVGALFNAAVTRTAEQRGALTVAGLKADLGGYVDEAALERAWRTFQAGGDAEQVHSAFLLSAWLREHRGRPVVPD